MFHLFTHKNAFVVSLDDLSIFDCKNKEALFALELVLGLWLGWELLEVWGGNT